MVRSPSLQAIAAVLTLAAMLGLPAVGEAQVWAHGIDRQRAPNLIGELPVQPPRPGLPSPRFTPHNILPEPMRFNAIPKDNIIYDNLRPSYLENRAIETDTIVKEQILPQRIPRTIEKPERMPREIMVPQRLSFGSTIFLPAMPPPRSLHHRDRMSHGDMAMPHERRALGW